MHSDKKDYIYFTPQSIFEKGLSFIFYSQFLKRITVHSILRGGGVGWTHLKKFQNHPPPRTPMATPEDVFDTLLATESLINHVYLVFIGSVEFIYFH